MDYFLGIFGGQGPNAAAALVRGGELICFCEEERFSRIKGAPSALPIQSISYCLSVAQITLDQVREIGFGWDCERYVADTAFFIRSLRVTYDCPDEYNENHEERLFLNFNPIKIKTDLRFGLAKLGMTLDVDKLKFHRHHLCHAASSFFCSGFENAAILTLDGSGEEYSCVVWSGSNGHIAELQNFKLPNSLGGYYATFTEFLGFKADEEEGKLMGLAPYGSYDEELQKKLSKVLYYDGLSGEFTVDQTMRFAGSRKYGQRFTDKLVEIFGEPRLKHQTIEKRHQDLAFNVQWRLEMVAKSLAKKAIKDTGSENICLSGGVAMNCKMNGVIAVLPEVKNIFVQPASSDAGTALGAAYLSAKNNGINSFTRFEHAYWGVRYSDQQIEEALIEAKIDYYRSEDIVKETAEFLSRNYIIGWFQGAAEVGARALGGRSILANPMLDGVKEKLNLEVKHRENWRPFCPSLTDDEYTRFFPNLPNSDFMILAFPVEPDLQAIIPGAVHVDGTARPHRVTLKSNEIFYTLLKEFGRLSGYEVLINTSFNVQGEPIVNTPRDAIRCFGGTGIDILAIGNFIAKKPNTEPLK